VYVFGVWEITYRANTIARKDGSYIEMFLLAALMYWTLTIISSWGQRWLENRMGHAYER
jgi:ABC-type amino acid transport system permease subunit